MTKYPKYLYRRDDGEKFAHKGKGVYVLSKSMMFSPHHYPYELLIRNGFKDSIDKCKIVEHKSKNDGHSNEYD
jgi:hypothetical protein